MARDREVAGIRCFEVLERLSDYLDDELPPSERARVDAHLAGCDWCERFGGAMGRTVGALRSGLAPTPFDAERAARLAAALADAAAEPRDL
jgi:anti-sigma factor RsiW